MAKAFKIAGNSRPKTTTPSSSSPEKVSLPNRRIVPPKNLHDYTICIFGEKSVGKTSLCAEFPEALVFQWEAGRAHLPIYQVPQEGEGRLTWPKFLKYIDLFMDSDFKTGVIDTIDRAWEACQSWYCKEHGFKHPNDARDYGATWQAIRENFAATMATMRNAGKRLVFTSHAKLKEVTTKTGRVYEMVVPTCPNQAWEFLKEVADIMLYYGYHDRERAFTIRGNDALAAACGLKDRFLDPDGNPLTEFPAGKSAEEAYMCLLAAFDNTKYGYPVDETQESDKDSNSEEEAEALPKKSAKRGKK